MIAKEQGEQFKKFMAWALVKGYDCAYTCDSDSGQFIALNPMTADLWEAWKAAIGQGGAA